jgi:hypothetical protein
MQTYVKNSLRIESYRCGRLRCTSSIVYSQERAIHSLKQYKCSQNDRCGRFDVWKETMNGEKKWKNYSSS